MKPLKHRIGTVMLATALSLGVPVVGSGVLQATPAAAAGCTAGTWGGKYAWGDCRGIPGNKKWIVKVSCTWGQSRTSSVQTGPGHTDAGPCPLGTGARGASIAFL